MASQVEPGNEGRGKVHPGIPYDGPPSPSSGSASTSPNISRLPLQVRATSLRLDNLILDGLYGCQAGEAHRAKAPEALPSP